MTRLFLCGDVMIGRGIDQILPHPGDPTIFERYSGSALDYVKLGEQVSGPLRRRVEPAYIWGDAIEMARRMRPDARIVNLETSVTTSDDYRPKGINYRANPQNVGCLTAMAVDCCVLANNHVMDWGERGLLDTLDTIRQSGMRTAGAGRNQAEAAAPGVLPFDGARRLLVFAFGLTSSGIPREWAASAAQPGVNLLLDMSSTTIDAIARDVRQAKRPGDLAMASIHWGENWGHCVPQDQIRFAHALVEQAGVDLVHGHSSHHAKAIDVHAGKLILYGCGDFINDYEGIAGYEQFRGDLALAYFPCIRLDGSLQELLIAPFQIRRFRLDRASTADVDWLRRTLSTESKPFDTRLDATSDGLLRLAW